MSKDQNHELMDAYVEDTLERVDVQPQPDESDEATAINVAELARDMRNRPYDDFALAVETLISRHTAAKVAEAEDRGWKIGAEAMRVKCADYVESAPLYNAFTLRDGIMNNPLPRCFKCRA